MFYLRQIGSFYIGWMDNISSSPSLIETTLFNSNIWKLMFMFFTDWQVGENFKDILWKSMNCWSSPLPSYTSLKLWGFELNLIWKRPKSHQKRQPKKSRKKATWQELHKCCDNVAWTSSSLILKQGFRHTKKKWSLPQQSYWMGVNFVKLFF